jgi:hypothetical protein
MSSFERIEGVFSSMLHCDESGLSHPLPLRTSIVLNYCRVALIVPLLRQKDREMQIRSKAYEHFISMCRSFRDLVSPHDQGVRTPTSPALVYAATLLSLLLAILEIDLHQAEFHFVGLVSDGDQVDPIFLSLLSQ